MTLHIILGLLIGIAISALWPSLDRLCRRLKPPRGRHMNAAEFRAWIHQKDYISRPLRPSRAKKRQNKE